MSLRPGFSVGRVPASTPPQKPNLKLVEGSESARLERLSSRARLFALVTMVAVVLFGVVAFHVVLSQGQVRLEQMQRDAASAQGQYERIRLQVAQLESPSRITAEAQNRLGMVRPEKVTPVAPAISDMPPGVTSAVGPERKTNGRAAPSTDTDAGDWEKIKPHLNSFAK